MDSSVIYALWLTRNLDIFLIAKAAVKLILPLRVLPFKTRACYQQIILNFRLYIKCSLKNGADWYLKFNT